MIGVENQYQIMFDIGEKKDFLAEEDFQAFTLIEEAGNVLPTWEMAFTTADEEILSYCNEGNVVQYSYGLDIDDFTICTLRISKASFQKAGRNKYLIVLIGLYDAIGYLSDSKVKSFPSKSGIEVIKAVAAEYFETDFNISNSSDNMTWIQSSLTGKRFINDVWMHCDIPDSFPAIGISSEGIFIVKDIVKVLKEEPKWKMVFYSDATAPALPVIICDGDYSISSQSGFINQWIGYGKTKSIRELETAIDSSITPVVQPVMSPSDSLNRIDLDLTRRACFSVKNENMTSKYWDSYLHNLTYLALMGVTQIKLSYTNVFVPEMNVLDLVHFGDDENSTKFLVEQYSGLYFITKIARTIQNRSTTTTIELNRETLGVQQGEFK